MAVDLADGVVALRAELYARDIAQPDGRSVGRGLEHDGAELVGRLKLRHRGDGGVEHLLRGRGQPADLARRDLGVLRLDGRDHVARHQRHRGQSLGVEPHAHGVRRAIDINVAHALDARERVLDRGDEVVRNIVAGAGVGAVPHHHRQQLVGVRLGDAHALRLDLLRQPRERGLDLVLDLDLRDVGIGALGEGGGYGGRPLRRGLRAEVEQPVEPAELLLDDLRDAVLDRRGRSARIAGADVDVGGRDIGILLDRQRQQRADPAKHHDDRQHPGENRPVDEDARHRPVRSRACPNRHPRRRQSHPPGAVQGAARRWRGPA